MSQTKMRQDEVNEAVKVSLIVPVYKVEDYLPRCLDSLVQQTLDGVELVCINDGSPDRCPEILRQYKEKYPKKRIVIIDKPNEGVWKGRMDGIRAATGEYIGFVDSDDLVTLDFAEKLYLAAKKEDADVSVCGFLRMDTDTGHVYSKEMLRSGHTDLNAAPETLLSLNGALWNKLFRAKVLKEMQDLENPPRILDDMMFQLLALLNADTLTFIPEAMYKYMVRADSIIMKIRAEQVVATQEAMLRLKEMIEADRRRDLFLPVLDALSFLHFGLSLTLRLYADKDCDFKAELKKMRAWLNANFSSWRRCRYLNLWFALTHRGVPFRLAFMKKIYVLHLYRAFLRCYTFMIEKLKVDVKW